VIWVPGLPRVRAARVGSVWDNKNALPGFPIRRAGPFDRVCAARRGSAPGALNAAALTRLTWRNCDNGRGTRPLYASSIDMF
jgi:hypothetical protein